MDIPKTHDELRQLILKHYRFLAEVGKAKKALPSEEIQVQQPITINVNGNLINERTSESKGIVKFKQGKIRYVHKYTIRYKPVIKPINM
jgi:hypothetical protein